MSELRDLIEIYRAIDAAILQEPHLIEQVAPFIKPYSDPDAVGWTRALDEYLGLEPLSDEILTAGIDQTLVNLSDMVPEGRMQSRFLLALTVLARVVPRLGLGGADGALLLRAMAPTTQNNEPDEARHLLELALDPGVFPELEAWSRFTDIAVESGVLRSTVATQPAPCSGSLVMEDVEGDPDPVARLATHFCSDTVSDAAVLYFLDPANWPNCTPLYCGMLELGPNTNGPGDRYVEVLSPDCNDPNAVRIEVCLVFTLTEFDDNGDGVVDAYNLHYDMCDDTNAGNGKVVIDHGDILVERSGTGWCFTSTKYVRFAGVIDGSATALFACALGYGSYAEDFLHTCYAANTELGPGGGGGGTQTPTKKANPRKKATPTKKAIIPQQKAVPKKKTPPNPQQKGGCMPQDMTKIVDDFAAWASSRITVYAAATKATVTKIADGKYSGEEVSADIAGALARLADDFSGLMAILPKAKPDANNPNG